MVSRTATTPAFESGRDRSQQFKVILRCTANSGQTKYRRLYSRKKRSGIVVHALKPSDNLSSNTRTHVVAESHLLHFIFSWVVVEAEASGSL